MTSRSGPDLSYRQLKAIITFQRIFRAERQVISYLNNTLDMIYSTLLSVTNNLGTNYISGIVDSDHYRTYMDRASQLSLSYRGIDQPVTFRTLRANPDIRYHISYLHYQLTELVKICGASRCHDIIRIFGGDDWDLDMSPVNIKFLKLFNTMFVPVSAKTSILNVTDVKVIKSGYTNHLTLKIHGAEIIFPLHGKACTIRGYFREDPLNISRLRGTMLGKLEEFKIQAKAKFGDNDIIDRYLEQISLRDFLSLNVEQLVSSYSNDLKELEKLKKKPKGHLLEEFLKASPNRQYYILTLLLVDTSAHDHAQAIITVFQTGGHSINSLYQILPWNLQRIFDALVKQRSKDPLGIDDSTIVPYETRIDNMRCSESIRKKAKDKLKEIRASKDGNDKAARYLDGLLRIPFGIYRKEKIIRFMDEFRNDIVEYHDALLQDTIDDPTYSAKLGVICNYFSRTPHAIESEIDALVMRLYSDISFLPSEHILFSKAVAMQQKWQGFKVDRKQYLNNVRTTLQECMYGQDKAKRNIESIIAQWINGEMSGVVFGFQGYPGTGKTTLAKQGIAKCLLDDEGNPRPFYFTSLGGSNGASFLLGHGYTYVGSQQGKIAEYVQDAKIMNPILYFDELDKVSNTAQGDEIIRVLTHLLDPEQNDHIEDRYFGVEMDLSKALIILSYNDSSVIDGILMDRIHEINFKQYNPKEKIIIAKKYILPRILKSHGFPAEGGLIMDDELLSYIIETYTCEAGVRDMKEKLTIIIREINLRRIYNDEEYQLPFTITKGHVDDIIESKNKIHLSSIPAKSQIGWVNGLYATSIGTGGITVIEAYDTPSDQKYALELTGKLGDVMKESVVCAKTNSWALFKGTQYYERVNKEWRENALHVHFPAAGTSKDGPSAGAAITTAIVSYFSKLPFMNYVAMTGEIDLHGNICPIGGLQCKIEGAQRAGVKIVLIPRRNEDEYLTFRDNYRVKVFAVDNISQVIRTCLIGATDTCFNYQHNIVDDPVVTGILEAISSSV
jgi:ATP-dependent Lon protease